MATNPVIKPAAAEDVDAADKESRKKRDLEVTERGVLKRDSEDFLNSADGRDLLRAFVELEKAVEQKQANK